MNVTGKMAPFSPMESSGRTTAGLNLVWCTRARPATVREGGKELAPRWGLVANWGTGGDTEAQRSIVAVWRLWGSPGRTSLTCGLIQALLCDVVVLADPLAIALEVDLCGGDCAAEQFHGLVLHNVGVLGLLQEVRQLLRGCRRQGVWEDLAT